MKNDPTRRMLLTALAGLSLANASGVFAATNNVSVQGNSRILVAYFSRSGNTRVIAGVIHRSLKTDLFEIEPAAAYPEDYFQTVEQASDERTRGIKPAIRNNLKTLENYQIVYLGFPVWGTSVPPVVQTFLSSHNFAGKTIIPFITHGGYGQGDSEAILTRLAPAAQQEKPLIIECDQERRTTETVTRWLTSIRD